MQPLWKTIWRFLKKLKIELPYDPAFPLLAIYLKKMKILIWKHACTPMFTFTAEVFTVTKIWKQPKCPSTDEWIKKMYTHDEILLSHIKEWNFAICNNMDGLGGCCAKWNKSDRERQILYDTTYMRNLKIQQTSEYNKKETDSQI